jgi:hypothetical protein
MERDIVLEASRHSGLSPRYIFFLAHRKHRRKSEFFHYEWLIFGTVDKVVAEFVLDLPEKDWRFK